MKHKIVFFIFIIISTAFSYQNEKIEGSYHFEKNNGQLKYQDGSLANDIIYFSKMKDYNVYFKSDKVIYVFSNYRKTAKDTILQTYRVDLNFNDCNLNKLTHNKPTKFYKNYYSKEVKSELQQCYYEIIYENIYDGIDLKFYFKDGSLKYDFILERYSNLKDIKLEYVGYEDLNVTESIIKIQTPFGNLVDHKPISFQENKLLKTEFANFENYVSFDVDYDISKELIIDPEISWITYFGGSGTDRLIGVEVDNNNDIIAVGGTDSPDIPITPGLINDNVHIRENALITKFNTNGEILFSTVISANNRFYLHQVKVDSKDNLWIAAETGASDLPITPTAYQKKFGGKVDGVGLKVSPEGFLEYLTYHGAGDYDSYSNLAIDNNDNVWYIGRTGSGVSFPVLSNAKQPKPGNTIDGFLVKYDNNANQLYSSFFGGRNTDYPEGIKIDNQNNLFVSMVTLSDDLIIKGNTFQNHFGGEYDVYLAKIDSTGGLIWSTYFGGSGHEHSGDLCLDENGNIFLVGYTDSKQMPIDINSFQKSHNNLLDLFLSKFNSSGYLEAFTYFGGNSNEGMTQLYAKFGGLEYDGKNFHNTFETWSTDLWTSDDAFISSQSVDSRSAYYLSFDKNLQPVYGTYLRGGNSSEQRGQDVDLIGMDAVVVGWTTADDFPTTSNAFQKDYQGNTDGFIVKFGYDCPSVAANILGKNVLCQGDSTELFVEPGYDDYVWSTGESGNRITVDSEGDYYVTIRHDDTCFTELGPFSVRRAEPKEPRIYSDKTELCDGDTAEIIVAGEYAGYLWSNGETTKTITATKEGTYYVVITDENGCEYKSNEIDIISIDEQSPFIIASQEVLCEGETATLTANTDYISYLWSTGETTKSIVVGEPGIYTLEVEHNLRCHTNYAEIEIGFAEGLQFGAFELDSSWKGGIFSIYCDSLEIVNPTDREAILNIEDITLDWGIEFSIPAAQFPIVIPAGSNAFVNVCFYSEELTKFFDRINLYKGSNCGDNLELVGTGLSNTYEDNTKCETEIELTSKDPQNEFNPVFPIPAWNSINVRSDLVEKYDTFIIYDMTTSAVLQGELSERLDLSSLESGVYFLRLINDLDQFHYKIVVIK